MTTFVPKTYEQLRAKFPLTSVSIGFWGIELVPSDRLPAAQLGYSVLPKGVNPDASDWKESWLVIGRETLCGDPVFIETEDPVLPVYTAAHGTGLWEPQLIAPSLIAFFELMAQLKELAPGRESPVALDNNPIPRKELQRFRKVLSACLGRRIPLFWKSLWES